jgi:hypothetical protein
MVEIAERDRAVSWLLKNENPGVRYWTLKDILGKTENDPEAIKNRSQVASWNPVAQYLSEQHPFGYWGDAEDVYWPKWRATVWSLILLGEMGVPGTHPSIKNGCEYFLKVMDRQDRTWPTPMYPAGDLRSWRAVWEPCVTGNMARTLTVFGFENDPRVREMFEWLVKNQRDDGGWNCETEDYRPEKEPVHHSSFMSTIEPLWAFSSLHPQKWLKGGREAVERGVEFLLMHRLFKSDRTGKVIREEWTQLHFPLFYFYDILHGLRVITDLSFGEDERATDARELLLSKRLPDGTWPLEATFLRSVRHNFARNEATGQWQEIQEQNTTPPNYKSGGTIADIPNIYSSIGEVGKPNPWVTLNALRVLKSGN